MILLYLITVYIAPQLWVDSLLGLRVDLILYPLWFCVLAVQGKAGKFFDFNLLDGLYVSFILWTILSSILNDQNPRTWTIIFFYVKWFVLYRLIIMSIDNIEGVIKFAKCLMVVVFIIVIEGIQHKLSPNGLGWAGQTLGWVDPSVLAAGGTGRTKWVNIFDGPGSFCVMYTMALPFVLQYLDKHYSKLKNIIAMMFLCPWMIAIWYTGSRGGFLATISVFGIYLLIRSGISIKKIIPVALMAVIVFMAAPTHLTQVRDENRSAQHRVDAWIKGVEMVEENPLFGVGRGNYVRYTGTIIAHNSAIENMSELGLPGLIIWLSMLYIAFKYYISYIKITADGREKSFVRAWSICLAGYLVSSMFVTLEYEIFYFQFALAGSVSRLQKTEVTFSFKEGMVIACATVSFVIFLKFFFRLYY